MRVYINRSSQQQHIQMTTRSRIRGLNFDGTVELTQHEITAELVDYTRGSVYEFNTNSEQLKNDFKRYLVVRKITQLFEELTLNTQTVINEQGHLILPIEVIYRGRSQPLNIEIRLKKKEIESDRELNKILLKEIERMSQESAFVDKYRQKVIQFKGDESNLNFKNFQLSNGGRVVKYAGNNAHSIFNHFQPLSKSGIFFYKAKIIKTYSKNLIFGVCSGEIKSLVNIYHSPYFIGLLLSERTMLGNSKSDVAITPVQILQGKSVIKVEVDLNKGVISWFLDGVFLCARKIPREILVKEVFPLVSFYNNADTIEFVIDQ